MLQGEALRRRGERSSPLQASHDFSTSLFGLGSARVSRVGDRVLAIADFSIKTVSARRMRYPEQERTLNHQQRIVIARRKPLATPYDMSAYIIVEIEITDPVGYEEYKKLAGPTVERHGGKYIVRGGACEMLEGDWNPKRIVILQFQNMERAKAWLNCPEYAEPRKIRHRTAKTRMILVEGLSS
jgi:uncharacterized protein (DUF1330 family)